MDFPIIALFYRVLFFCVLYNDSFYSNGMVCCIVYDYIPCKWDISKTDVLQALQAREKGLCSCVRCLKLRLYIFPHCYTLLYTVPCVSYILSFDTSVTAGVYNM